MATIDYGQVYDQYWARPDRIGSHSFSDPMVIVRAILQVSGPTRILDVGSGMGGLVQALLRSGCDAQGVDASTIAVEHANRRAFGRYRVASALALPFADGEFPTVVSTDFLEHLDQADVAQALREMWRVCSDTLFLRVATTQDRDNHWHLTVQPREWWEEQLLLTGFRKHPMQLDVIGYEEIETEGDTITLVMQKIPPAVERAYPLDALRHERQLHMDMTREPGRRSDAHVIRYRLARQFIRPGDTVLDIACGLGYGAAMMAYGSGAARIIGVDNSPFAIDYAKGNFIVGDGRLEFRCEDGADLDWLEDGSVDYVVSMETLEHLPDPPAFLTAIARVLKPAGRIFASIPNMWVDETGRDPNPHHLHVYDLATLKAQLTAHFDLEGIWEQTAGGAFKLPQGQRRLRRVDLRAEDIPDPEWWLCLAMKSPLAGSTPKAYVETEHLLQPRGSSRVADFSAWYDNPYLHTGIVNRGSRLQDPATLCRTAWKAVAASAENSPDRGGALSVLAYAVLDTPGDDVNSPLPAIITEDPEHLVRLITEYLASASTNVHVKRWQISLAYALGLIMRARGDIAAAETAFRHCIGLDPLEFSPLIATKTLASSLALAEIELARNDREGARNTLTLAVERATTIIGRDWPNVIGSAEKPLTFGFIELAEVCDLAAKCAIQAEALTRGWSTAFAWARGLMVHREQLEGLRRANHDLQEQIGWWRKVVAQKDAHLHTYEAKIWGNPKELAGNASFVQPPLAVTIARVRRFRALSARFIHLARTEGMESAVSRASLSLKIRLAHRMPALRRYKRFGVKFVEHARTRGLKAAFNRAQSVIAAEAPFLRGRAARQAAREFEAAMSTAVEPRRIMREPDMSCPRFAMLVKDFHDGGLEKVVTDLALQFLRQGISCPILVAGSAGRAASHASSLGCEIRIFNNQTELLLTNAECSDFDAIFTHHCYDGLERLSNIGIRIIEVIHNAYHWQRKDSYLADLRRSSISDYVAVSDFVRKYAASYLSIPTERIHLIENGLSRDGLIRPRLQRVSEERKATLGHPVLVHLANAHEQKNHIALLQAFEIVRQSHPGTRLVLAGVIDDKTELGCDILAWIADKDWKDHVRLAGPLGRRELSHLLAGAHVGLLPSMVEGFSIASLEYTYFGLPMVLSDTGAARRLANEFQHAVIADGVALLPADLNPAFISRRSRHPDPTTASSIAKAILSILSDYDHYLDRAAEAGSAWRNYSNETTGRRYLDLVKELTQ